MTARAGPHIAGPAPAAPRRRGSDAVQLAARWIQDGRRLELQGLADELGIARVTLFRQVGTREVLLGEAVWLLTEQALRAAYRRWDRERPAGALRSVGTARYMNALVSRSTALRRLLDDEPALTFRVLTDPRGPVQPRVVAFVEGVLREDMAEFGFEPLIAPGDLAYALVRLGESFLYADVLAARSPDVDSADRLQQAVLEATTRPSPPLGLTEPRYRLTPDHGTPIQRHEEK